VLSDREVSPQLGLLKSTLLQLDSTFSERTYGAGSFRDFAQKLASAGYVTLREAGRNVLVELKENGAGLGEEGPRPAPHPAVEREAQPAAAAPEPRLADGIREVRRLFQTAQNPPRWPMYIRQAKQFLRNVDPTFDERKFGFASLVDLIRACQREGLFRIERDRQGVMRIFAGNVMQSPVEPISSVDEDVPVEEGAAEEPQHLREQVPLGDVQVAEEWVPVRPANDAEVVDGDVVQEMEAATAVIDATPAEDEPPARKRGRGRSRAPSSEGRPARKTEGAAPRARKGGAKPRAHRARARKDAPRE
jgi:hypothetical protein